MRCIDEQYLKTLFYGSRRMAAVLSQGGPAVNRKREQRLMRQMGLEALYPKPRTYTYVPMPRGSAADSVVRCLWQKVKSYLSKSEFGHSKAQAQPKTAV